MVTGKEIIIVMDGEPIAACKSQEITVNGEKLEKASPTQGSWREFVPGRKDWGVNSNHLVPTVAKITDVLLVGSVVTLLICDEGQSTGLMGQAIVDQAKQSYIIGNLAVGSFRFTGTGPLVEVANPSYYIDLEITTTQ